MMSISLFLHVGTFAHCYLQISVQLLIQQNIQIKKYMKDKNIFWDSFLLGIWLVGEQMALGHWVTFPDLKFTIWISLLTDHIGRGWKMDGPDTDCPSSVQFRSETVIEQSHKSESRFQKPQWKTVFVQSIQQRQHLDTDIPRNLINERKALSDSKNNVWHGKEKCCFFYTEEDRRTPSVPFSEVVLVAGDIFFVTESFQRLNSFERSTLCLSFPHSLQPGQPRMVNLNVEKHYLRAQKETWVRGKQNS